MRIIKEIMQATDSACEKEDNLKVITCRMFFEEFTILPVVNEEKKVIGVITYKDAIKAVEKSEALKITLRVSDIMKVVPCIYAYEDEASALSVMRNSRSAYLPVVDAENHLEGMISFMVLARRIIGFKKRMDGSGKLNFGGFELSA